MVGQVNRVKLRHRAKFRSYQFLCECLFDHLRVRLYSCMRVCVRAALLVAGCAASTALHLCGCFALNLSAQVRKTMNDC